MNEVKLNEVNAYKPSASCHLYNFIYGDMIDANDIRKKLNLYLNNREESLEEYVPNTINSNNLIRKFHVTKFILQEKKEIFIQVRQLITTLHQLKCGFFMKLHSDGIKITFEVGVNKTEEQSSMTTIGRTLKAGLEGLFTGVELSQNHTWLSDSYPNEIYDNWSLGSVAVIPNNVEENKEQQVISAIEHLVSALKGRKYDFIFISDPIQDQYLDQSRIYLQQLWSDIDSQVKTKYNYTDQESISNIKSITESHNQSESISDYIAKSNVFQKGSTRSHNETKRRSRYNSINEENNVDDNLSNTLNVSNIATNQHNKKETQDKKDISEHSINSNINSIQSQESNIHSNSNKSRINSDRKSVV